MSNEYEDDKLDRREKFERDRQRSRTTGGYKDGGPRKKRLEPYKRQNNVDYLEDYEEYDEWE